MKLRIVSPAGAMLTATALAFLACYMLGPVSPLDGKFAPEQPSNDVAIPEQRVSPVVAPNSDSSSSDPLALCASDTARSQGTLYKFLDLLKHTPAGNGETQLEVLYRSIQK